MASSSSNSTGHTWSFPTTPTLCRCGLECPMWTSQRAHSRGRRFIGCPFFKVRERYCGFFRWYDDDFSERAKEVIKGVDAQKDVAVLKLAATEAKLAEIEAKKLMEIGELEMRLKKKEEEIARLKWFRIVLLLGVYGLLLKMMNFF